MFPTLLGLAPGCPCAALRVLRTALLITALWLAGADGASVSAQSTPDGRAAHDGPRNVAVFVYEGVELLDFSGPGEVFAATMTHGVHPYRVFTVATSKQPLTSQGFLTVTPTYDFADCPRPDIIVLPGGNVPFRDPQVIDWVKRASAGAEITMSVCNGALVAGAAGLLDGLDVTTHRGTLLSLALRHPTASVHPELRLVDNGRVLTTGGVSAGIDGALAVVARLQGPDVARQVADYMEYRWDPDDLSSPVPQRVDGATLAAAGDVLDAVRVGGVGAGLELWRELEARGEVAGLDEALLNQMGYAQLHGGGGAELGVAVFGLAAAAYPASPNARDSLSEALLALGRHDDAAEQARECLRLLDAADGPVANAERLRELSEDRLASLGADADAD